MAKEFINGSKKVCLLESGGLSLDLDTQALYQGTVAGWPYWPLDACRIRFFGGSTNHWGGACIPLSAGDFELRSWVPDSGWPITKDDLVPFYERAQVVFKLGEDAYSARSFMQDRAIRQWVGDVITTGMRQISNVRFGLEYRDAIAQAANIDLYLHGNAVNVTTNEDQSFVRWIDAACLTGSRFRVQAQSYVLALGGIENARLLLESHNENGVGLGNRQDLVGRYFSDHAYLSNLGFVQITDPDTFADPFVPAFTSTGNKVGFHLELTPEVRAREQLLSAEITMKRVEWDRFHRDRGAPRPDFIDRVGNKLSRVVQDLRGENSHTPRSNNPEDYGAPMGTQLYRFGAWTESVPRAESRVTLSDERDALGLRKPVLDWRLGEAEKISLIKTLALLGKEIGRMGVGRMRLDLDEDSPWPWQGGGEPGLHLMGTTRMSNSPTLGVVDANCKIHGLANLYIAGSSVFPTYGTANPTLTIVALALRLCDHLKQGALRA